MSTLRKREKVRLVAAMTVLCAGAVLAAYSQLGGGAGHPPGVSLVGVGLAAGTDQSRFSISGGVAGLYPGSSLPLVLTISNPQAFTIDVTSITTTVNDANSGCPASLLSVTSFTGDLLVPANGTATLVVKAALDHSAPDACQGAIFPVTLIGTASKP